MKLLANMGELRNGKTALLIEKGGRLEYLLASGFDDSKEMGSKWSSADYYYNLTSFSRAVDEIQTVKLNVKNIELEDNACLRKDDYRYLSDLEIEVSDKMFLKNGLDPNDILSCVQTYAEKFIADELGLSVDDVNATSFEFPLTDYFKEEKGYDILDDYIEVTDIEWDYDEDDEHSIIKTAYVPKIELSEDYSVTDWLSDNIGFCVKSLEYDTDIEKEAIEINERNTER